MNNYSTRKVNINKSGQDGRNGNDGGSGFYSRYGTFGDHGGDGEAGADGAHANNIFINLSADETANSVVVTTPDEQYFMPLGDADDVITTTAIGGSGGNGGCGGVGGNGRDGSHGMDATRYWPGSNGGDGSSGGDGGNGGNGGRGGDAGNMTVTVNARDTDLLMLLATPELTGGSGGVGGRGGSGGSGGKGGSGGCSYSWPETVYSIHHDQEGRCHTDETIIQRTSLGGLSGRDGASGSDGHSGSNGSSGMNGRMTINVNDGNSYHGIYDLSLESIDAVRSDDNIIEPGELLAIHGVTFKNTGYMPTPMHQAVQVALTPNKWIRFNAVQSSPLSGPIDPGYTKQLSQPLLFSVNKSALPHAQDTTFHQTGILQFNACLSRVNKNFKDVPAQTHAIDIRYPVEISTVAIPPVIARGEEAPFVLKIRNVSTQPIGIDASKPRRLEVKLSSEDTMTNLANALTYIDAETMQERTLDTPVKKTVKLLPAGQAAYFTGSLKFPSSTPVYAKTRVHFQLHLGNLAHPAVDQEVIQQRNIQLQLSDRFIYDEAADMVLVINNNTSPETVRQWMEKADMLGTTLSVWNTSLYAGLSYTKKRQDQKNFIGQMHGKVMIILNNDMNIENQKTHSTDCLDAMEILDAAINANVSTYVVGGNFNLQGAITPLAHVSRNDQTYTVKDRYFFWNKPAPEHLMKKAAAITQRLQKENPDQRVVPVVSYDPAREATDRFHIRPVWELGKVEARNTLGHAQAHVAVRHASPEVTLDHHVDLFNVLKLMPFARKLQYLDKAVLKDNKAAADLISTAILSDLTDELLTFAKDKWNGSFTRDKLSSAMVNLKLLSEHQFAASGYLRGILTNYDYIANRLPTNYDKYLFPFWCRRTRLRNISHAAVSSMLEQYFPDSDLTYSKINLEQSWGSMARARFFENFSTPYKNDVVFDTQLNVSEPIQQIALPSYQKKKSNFIERFHLFSSNHDRKQQIEEQKKDCRFEL